MYEVDDVLLYSYYLLLDANSTVPEVDDIVVSNSSDGLIETVVKEFKVDDTRYLESKLQRCNENSRWNFTRYSNVLSLVR